MKHIILAFLFLASIPTQAAITLKNGKNFLYEHDPKALVSTVQIVFRTGSLSDPKGKEGLASIAFESLLRGTKDKNYSEFNSALERLGANISVDTSASRTIISLDTISDNLKPAMDLLADAVLKPGLRDQEIKNMMGEELAQLEQEKSNNRALAKRTFRQALYHGSALAFPSNGTIDGLNNIKLEDIQNFLQKSIKSGNMIVAVSSNRSEKDVKELTEATFKELPEGAAPVQASPAVPAPKGRQVYVLERKGSSTTEMLMGHQSFPANYNDRVALETGMFVFGSDFTSRFMTVLRKDNGWTYGAYASYEMMDLPRRHGGTFSMYAFPQSQFTDKATLKALELYSDYIKKGITKKELEFAQNSLANSYAFKFATSKSRLTARLYSLLDGAPNLSVNAYRGKVRGLTQASIADAVKKQHDADNMVIVLVGDPEKVKPLASAIPGAASVKTVADPMKEF